MELLKSRKNKQVYVLQITILKFCYAVYIL